MVHGTWSQMNGNIHIETIYTFELSNCKFCKFKVLYLVTLEFLSFDTCKKKKRISNVSETNVQRK